MKIAVFDTQWNYDVTTPYNNPLGGTQSAICYFLEEMATKHEMYLFNKINEIKEINNIKHIPVSNYISYLNIKFDIVIVSCISNEIIELKDKFNNADTLYCMWTGHDTDQKASLLLKNDMIRDMVDMYIFVSKWQQERFITVYNIPYAKTMIMKNGIGKPFEKFLDLPSKKTKNSMTYCSIPWRGLDLLAPIYKEISNKYDTSLNIFSGLNIYGQNNNVNQYDEFKELKNVTCNTGVSQTKLAEELYTIEYLTYPNIFPETSCITVLQAMASGCIVITSDLGALKETMNGMNCYIDINHREFNKEQYIMKFTTNLSNYIELDDNDKEHLREQNRKYIKMNYTWSIICEQFEKDISEKITLHKQYMRVYQNNITESINTFSNGIWLESLTKFNKLNTYPNLNLYYIINTNMGVCYFKLNQLDLSKKYFKIAKKIKDDFNVNKNLALLELQRDNIPKFLKYGRIALNQVFDPFLAGLIADKSEKSGYYQEAIGLYESINRIDKDNISCLNNLGNLYLLFISQLESIDMSINSTYMKSLEICNTKKEHRNMELVLSNIIFNNMYNWTLSEEEIFKRSTMWYKYFPKDETLVSISNKLLREHKHKEKIRIGYISTDFVTHPVGFMFDSILKNHNVNMFEIFCYDNSNFNNTDFISKRLRSYNNATWRQITNTNDMDLLTILIDDDLDILVDMMGHTRNTRMNVLQYKPARIIVSYFAYPGTTGLKEVDYKFSDMYATPPETQDFFTEKLWLLPNGFQCYTPPIEIDGTKTYSREPGYPINLACFNNPTKLSIPTIKTFANVLKALPESRLFLRYCYYRSSYYKESIIRLFVEQGVQRERIDVGFDQLIDSLKSYNNIDIVLDPFPYNGGTISSEALYMNSPIVTLAGSTYVSRVGVSLLSNIGLEKYIAKTPEEYVQKVVDLARNKEELLTLHQTIRLRMMNSDLGNAKSFTKHIEEAYTSMINKKLD